MRISRTRSVIGVAAAVGITALAGAALASQGDASWTQHFLIEPDELRSTGRNPYFVLEPGYELVLEDGDERLTVTVLPETKTVAGVETRVVEERETKGGALVEISRNYFAISARTNSVFYFGEEVDMYRDGRVVSHEGAWLAGCEGRALRALDAWRAARRRALLPGDRARGSDGPRAGPEHDRPIDDAGRHVHECSEDRGDDAARAARAGIQVLRTRCRPAAGWLAQARPVRVESRCARLHQLAAIGCQLSVL
jgi:hypothetical protein